MLQCWRVLGRFFFPNFPHLSRLLCLHCKIVYEEEFSICNFCTTFCCCNVNGISYPSKRVDNLRDGALALRFFTFSITTTFSAFDKSSISNALWNPTDFCTKVVLNVNLGLGCELIKVEANHGLKIHKFLWFIA